MHGRQGGSRKFDTRDVRLLTTSVCVDDGWRRVLWRSPRVLLYELDDLRRLCLIIAKQIPTLLDGISTLTTLAQCAHTRLSTHFP